MPEFRTDDGVRLHYAMQGQGPLTLFYLHGMGGDVGTWKHLWSVLDRSRFSHVALDFRGHGGSQRMPSAFTAERLANDVVQLADLLDVRRFALLGHGFGGKVACRIAAQHPGRVAGVMLMGAVGPNEVPLEKEVVDRIVSCGDDVALVRQYFRSWFKEWPRPEIERWTANVANTPSWVRRAFCAPSRAGGTRSPTAIVTEVPAVVLAGESDPVYGPDYQQVAVLPALAKARLVTISCGHGLLLELPDEVTDHCKEFFSQLE